MITFIHFVYANWLDCQLTDYITDQFEHENKQVSEKNSSERGKIKSQCQMIG